MLTLWGGEAAGTQWNFLPFRLGLVGDHCIDVDFYYLTHKAPEMGYYPASILAGCRINGSIGRYIVESVIKLMTGHKVEVVASKILLLSLIFKESSSDIRNRRSMDVYVELKNFHLDIDIHDPWANADDVRYEYNIHTIDKPNLGKYDATILVVGPAMFKMLGVKNIGALGKFHSVLYDVKHLLSANEVDARL